jgi:hypothetical protein
MVSGEVGIVVVAFLGSGPSVFSCLIMCVVGSSAFGAGHAAHYCMHVLD